MMKPMFELPGRPEVKKAIVTADFINGKSDISLITE
jgi:hypothetical protein